MRRRQRIVSEQEILALTREFLKNRLSAAGVSYIVTSRSKSRRNIWAIVLLATAGFMTFMTYKVIKEYLKYPKSVIKEDSIEPRLLFPAVTVCSLNAISNKHLVNTSLAKIKKLKELLENSTKTNVNNTARDECYSNPMCRWSWFTELCSCMSSPCFTEFCVDDTTEICKCSSAMCDKGYLDLNGACDNSSTLVDGGLECQCKMDFRYRREGEGGNVRQRIAEVLELRNDTDLRDIIMLIQKADVVDLTDIEEDLMPTTGDIYRFGTEFDRLVISCSFEGRRCDKENFTIFFHAHYGKCYTFNYVGDKSVRKHESLEIHNYGSSSGLNLLLQAEGSEVVDLLSREQGIRVVVHDPKELPYVSEHGFNIRIHDSTAVELTLSTYKRLGAPWGSCMNDGSQLPFRYTDRPYNQLGCQKKCRHHYTQKSCNCTKRSFLRGEVVENSASNKLKFCSVKNSTESKCIYGVLEAIEKNIINCNCFPPCLEKQYKTSLSSGNINEGFFKMVRGVKTVELDDNGTKYSDSVTRRSDMVGLRVYYKTLQVEAFEEIPYYSWETLVANIGGNLGFFMGLSLVTFVEVFEFIWDLFLSVINRNTHKVHPTPTENRSCSVMNPSKSANALFPEDLQIHRHSPKTPLEGMIKDLLDDAATSHSDSYNITTSPRVRKFSRRLYGGRSFSNGRRRFTRGRQSLEGKLDAVGSTTPYSE